MPTSPWVKDGPRQRWAYEYRDLVAVIWQQNGVWCWRLFDAQGAPVTSTIGLCFSPKAAKDAATRAMYKARALALLPEGYNNDNV